MLTIKNDGATAGADSEDVRRHLKGILGLRKDRPGFKPRWRRWQRSCWFPAEQASAGRKHRQHLASGQPRLSRVHRGGWRAVQVRPGAHGPLGITRVWGHREVAPSPGVAVSWPRGHALGVYGWGKTPLGAPCSPPHPPLAPGAADARKSDQGAAPSPAASLQSPLPTKPDGVVSPRRGVRVRSFTKDRRPNVELGAERQ